MENAREVTLSILEDLINICKEEHILFKTASNKITNPFLKSTLDNCADEKDKNIHKLETEIERLGGKYYEEGYAYLSKSSWKNLIHSMTIKKF